MTPRARAAACAALLGAAMGVVSLHASGDRPSERAGARRPPFYFMMAYSGTTFGGAHGVENAYRALESPTLRIGVTVPVLYMRTTRGRAQDFAFDPRFDLATRCGRGRLADDALDSIIAHSVAKRLPTMFVLNGGVWADSACDAPEWDLNDHLEQDPRNCQWSQSDRVFADDHLRGLSGSIDSPELARSLTYNVHAADVRRYKRRNLQAAASRVAAFAKRHPELFVGVTLDADTYMNPFFNGEQWYDYNPGTLRQFREWLAGSGPYAGEGAPEVPDLRSYRRAQPLTLDDVNRLANARWTSWGDVDPPRRLPGSPRDALNAGDRAYWDDPWYNAWDVFRKHLVDLHYDELSRWAHEAGIPRDAIFSAQGFAAPYGNNRPFALRVASTGQNYDSAGMSLEGAKPSHGHLGAILYGRAAENDIPTENGRSLFHNFATVDPAWGVVEFSVAALNRADDVAGYARAYRAFRDIFNFDGRFVTPMAWNGSRGSEAGQPGFRPHTAWRETAAEDAMRHFARSRAGVPQGGRAWTFGSPVLASDDGWRATEGSVASARGKLVVSPQGARAVLESPPDQIVRPAVHGTLRIDLTAPARVRSLRVLARVAAGDAWLPLSRHAWRASDRGRRLDASLTWPREITSRGATASAVRIELEVDPGAPLEVARIALLR
jgi:hypothetical protein